MARAADLHTDRAYMEALADCLHAGYGWDQVAAVINANRATPVPERTVRTFYRARLTSYLRRRCRADGMAEHIDGTCVDGCTYELCRARRADRQRAWKAEVDGRADLPVLGPAELDRIAEGLHDGTLTWESVAAAHGRTVGWTRAALRSVLLERFIALEEADRPTGRHGQRAGYTFDRCRGQACLHANLLYARQRDRERATGRTRTVDARPAADHMALLRRRGLGLRSIAETAGVSRSALSRLAKDHDRPIARDIAEAILGVPVPDRHIDRDAYVPTAEASKVIDELLAAGWTKVGIARRVVSPDALSLQVNGNRVSRDRYDALRALLAEAPPQGSLMVDGELLRSLAAAAADRPGWDLTRVAMRLGTSPEVLRDPPDRVPADLIRSARELLAPQAA